MPEQPENGNGNHLALYLPFDGEGVHAAETRE
jgi:hypothetical protein